MLSGKLGAAIVSLLILAAAIFAGPSAAETTPEPVNVGFVLYNKTATPGTLLARWNYGNRYSGPGLATGGPVDGFPGHYHVRYFLENGEFSDEYDLVIAKSGDFYDVSWIVGGVVLAKGVGMLVEGGNGLAVGWRRVDR